MKLFYPFLLLFSLAFLQLEVSAQYETDIVETDIKEGFYSDLLKEIGAAEEKILALANEIPEAKYSWRPAEGVRSISEVLMHVVVGNHYLLSFAEVKMPDDINLETEKKITKKANVINALKNSYDSIRKNLSSKNDGDLNKAVDFFGNATTVRHILFILMDHNHEHLGQSIAYARINNITPPWSEGN